MVNYDVYINALIKYLANYAKHTQNELVNWMLKDINVNNISEENRDEICGKVCMIISKSFENPKVPGKPKVLKKKFVNNTLKYLTKYTIFDYKSAVLIHSFLTKDAKDYIVNTQFIFCDK